MSQIIDEPGMNVVLLVVEIKLGFVKEVSDWLKVGVT